MQQLVQLARNGDEQAISKLMQLHHTTLSATAFAYTKDYMEAQDIVQDTFIKAFQSLQQLKEPAYFSTWLYKILIRHCFHYIKKKERTVALAFELQQLQTLSHEPSSHFDELHEALNNLKEPYRSVVVLHYFYDFKLHEIAHLLNKPLNTVKVQIRRARLQLKQQLQRTQQTIEQQDVNKLLNNLKQIAQQHVAILKHYELAIEDIDEEGATFLWKENELEEGYYIRISPTGKLTSLSQPFRLTEDLLSTDELQTIAEQFISAEYRDALQYFTLSNVRKKENSTRFYFEQFVAGFPLQSSYCTIELSNSGQLVNFEYKPFQVVPPAVPSNFADTAPILEQLKHSDWELKLEYLSSDYYNVQQSGLYAVYHSSFLYHSFHAQTGEDLSRGSDDDFEETEPEQFVPIPHTTTDTPLTTVEDIIGIPPTMKRIRQADIDDGYVGIVWRDEHYEQPTDKSMQQFMLDRFEHTVKANVHAKTGELRGFVWFKERNGELALSYEQCEKIALTFMHTYYRAFVPYLKMKVKERLFNKANRTSFHFGIYVHDLPLEGEFFLLSVNNTTGLIDTFMATKIDVELLQNFNRKPLLPLPQALEALKNVDAILEWDKRYDRDTSVEMLIYRFKEQTTKESVKYIDAVSGEIITML